MYLDEEVHAFLRDLAERQGRTILDLVRKAIARAYGRGGAAEKLRTLDGIEGLWQDRRDVGRTDAYVRRLRRDTRRSRRRKS